MVIKRRYRYRRKQEEAIKQLRRNQQIRVPEVRLINENDINVGVVPTLDALRMAAEAEMDLVEVSPKAAPPVCRIMNYGQYEYKQEKLARKAKTSQKKVELKGLRLTFRMGEHDMETRKNQADKFLIKGNKIKLEMHLRGREKAHHDLARGIMKDFVSSLSQRVTIEDDIKRMGGKLFMVIVPSADTSNTDTINNAEL